MRTIPTDIERAPVLLYATPTSEQWDTYMAKRIPSYAPPPAALAIIQVVSEPPRENEIFPVFLVCELADDGSVIADWTLFSLEEAKAFAGTNVQWHEAGS